MHLLNVVLFKLQKEFLASVQAAAKVRGMEVCHHPFRCELRTDDSLKSGNKGPHTCCRPSHLLVATSAINKIHEGLNKIASANGWMPANAPGEFKKIQHPFAQ